MDLAKFQRKISRVRVRQKALRPSGSHLKNLVRTCLENITPVTAPIALISQIQRSGGSLLSQLFDGHPQIHAHPDELKIGHPKKYMWPKVDLNDHPQRWFKLLFEENVIKHFREGYKKGHKSEKRFAFIFLPSLQKEIFLKYLDSLASKTQRDVLDAYMTSYFGAWLNYQNFHSPKKFITGFTPRMAMIPDSMASFFEIYPDGRLISVIRDPKNWFPSAFRHVDKKRKYADIHQALSQWKQSAQSMVDNKEKYGDRACIIKFEDLISDTASVMRRLAEFLAIEFDDILLTPTFNKSPIAANTSFKIETPGIMTATLNRYKTLSPQELEIIAEVTGSEYQKVLKVAASV
jgi:hypothetical protein